MHALGAPCGLGSTTNLKNAHFEERSFLCTLLTVLGQFYWQFCRPCLHTRGGNAEDCGKVGMHHMHTKDHKGKLKINMPS